MSDFKELLTKETAGIPNWAWVAIVVAGIGATYVLPKLLGKKTNTSTPPTSSSDAGASGGSGLGLAVDPTSGLPYAVEGLVPSGATAGGSSSTSVGTTASSGLMSEVGLIRARGNSSLTSSYDTKNSQGIPIRTAPDAGKGTLGYEAYGSQVNITGPAVTGAYNLPNDKNGNHGTNLWYPVMAANGQTGYVSAYDFSGAPVQRTGAWPGL